MWQLILLISIFTWETVQFLISMDSTGSSVILCFIIKPQDMGRLRIRDGCKNLLAVRMKSYSGQ